MTKPSLDEVGITNLGPVPLGMSFREAIRLTKHHRKFEINPYEGGHRLTLCDTLRMLWREVDTLPEGPQKQQMREYIGACFDFGKRMDARMKELKEILNGRN